MNAINVNANTNANIKTVVRKEIPAKTKIYLGFGLWMMEKMMLSEEDVNNKMKEIFKLDGSVDEICEKFDEYKEKEMVEKIVEMRKTMMPAKKKAKGVASPGNIVNDLVNLAQDEHEHYSLKILYGCRDETIAQVFAAQESVATNPVVTEKKKRAPKKVVSEATSQSASLSTANVPLSEATSQSASSMPLSEATSQSASLSTANVPLSEATVIEAPVVTEKKKRAPKKVATVSEATENTVTESIATESAASSPVVTEKKKRTPKKVATVSEATSQSASSMPVSEATVSEATVSEATTSEATVSEAPVVTEKKKRAPKKVATVSVSEATATVSVSEATTTVSVSEAIATATVSVSEAIATATASENVSTEKKKRAPKKIDTPKNELAAVEPVDTKQKAQRKTKTKETINTPTVEAPTVNAQTVEAPTVEAPKIETPTVNVPTVQQPSNEEFEEKELVVKEFVYEGKQYYIDEEQMIYEKENLTNIGKLVNGKLIFM